jgi:phospholipid/cholesterol/gamma-HCH transport system substrate-binding protein
MAGAVGITVVLALVALLLAVYQKVFVPVVHVTVVSDRAGLLLDAGSSVRAFGIPVGEVRGTHLSDNGKVDIDIALDKNQVAKIPDDVSADIRSTTVFGPKAVELEVPRGVVIHPISAGDVIRSGSTTVEVNDTFRVAMHVLKAVRPNELNTTLTATAQALQGRGKKLGAYLTQVNSYLLSFNGHLPELDNDLRTGSHVLRTYADVAKPLIDTANQAATTGITLDRNSATLQAFLLDTTTASRHVSTFFDNIEGPLLNFNAEFTPVSALLRTYAPEFGCLLDNTAQLGKNFAIVYGNKVPGDPGMAGFLPGQASYDPQRDQPKLVTGVGPVCYPFPTPAHPVPPHVRFDDGTRTVYDGVGPVVNPGTLHDPYGNAYHPRRQGWSATDLPRSLRKAAMFEFLFGPKAARKMLHDTRQGSR